MRDVAFAAAVPVRDDHEYRVARQRKQDDERAAQVGFDPVHEQQAGKRGGHGAERDAEREARLHRLQFAAEDLQAALDQRDDVPAKEREDGQQRAEVHGDVERQALVGPLEKVRHEHEVPGTRNRQELGESLHDRENDDLQVRHTSAQ